MINYKTSPSMARKKSGNTARFCNQSQSDKWFLITAIHGLESFISEKRRRLILDTRETNLLYL